MDPLKWTESNRRVKAGIQYTFRATLKGGWIKQTVLNPTAEELADYRRRLRIQLPSQISNPKS